MERAATAAPAKEAARLGPVVLAAVPAADPALLVAPEVSADLVQTRVTSRARAATVTRMFRLVTTGRGPGACASVAGRRARGVPEAWQVSVRRLVTGRSGRTVVRRGTVRSVRPASVAPGRSGVRRATVPRVIGRSGRTVVRRETVRSV